LETREYRTQRAGALLALYRHVGEHLKLGLGFNFTDFNDDLTDIDYDNRGWFLDITAKY
jgi:muconolactone delta-isomerase